MILLTCSFKLSSKQANFKGKPYNGAESWPSLGLASQAGSYPANAWGGRHARQHLRVVSGLVSQEATRGRRPRLVFGEGFGFEE
jgi:hypothetical protein